MSPFRFVCLGVGELAHLPAQLFVGARELLVHAVELGDAGVVSRLQLPVLGAELFELAAHGQLVGSFDGRDQHRPDHASGVDDRSDRDVRVDFAPLAGPGHLRQRDGRSAGLDALHQRPESRDGP